MSEGLHRTEPTPLEKWLVLNSYGSLLLVLAAALAALGVFAGARLQLGQVSTAILALAPAVAAGALGCRITLRLPIRLRVFRAVIRRIRRGGFDARYFETLCGEPCMRCVTWLVLRRAGHLHEYRGIVQRYKANATFFIEHSDPAIDDLIQQGAVSERSVRKAVHAMLGDAAHYGG